MKKLTFLITIWLTIALPNLSQTQDSLNIISKLIEYEGKMLYYSEKASWHGTDILLEQKGIVDKVGGYLSYPVNDSVRCVFFSKAVSPTVIFSTTFDQTFDLSTVVISDAERFPSPLELDMYSMREKAIRALETDTIVKYYENTRLNLIPIINGSIKRVYVLTGPTKARAVLLGNDYLVEFDSSSNISSIQTLHKGLIPLPLTAGEDKQKTLSSMHSHVAGKSAFITPTDICTLMLYQPMTEWTEHIVMAPNYVSVWNCVDNSLTIMTRETYNKLSDIKDE